MFISLLFVLMLNDKSLINLLYYFLNFIMTLTEYTSFIWKHPFMIVETFKSKSLVVSRYYPAQPFCPVLVLTFALGNFLVAHICAWHHFLGVWLYSNYTTGHWNMERVLCLILPSSLVESASSTFILLCQSFLWECISWRGLLHYSEGLVFVSRKYCSTELFPTTKEFSRMTRDRIRTRKRHLISRKITDENDHSQTGEGEEIATPPSQSTSHRRGRPEELTEIIQATLSKQNQK
jgi:hypothetical protein